MSIVEDLPTLADEALVKRCAEYMAAAGAKPYDQDAWRIRHEGWRECQRRKKQHLWSLAVEIYRTKKSTFRKNR